MVGMNIFHCCLASYLTGFDDERFPRMLRVLVKAGSVHYWMYKRYGVVPGSSNIVDDGNDEIPPPNSVRGYNLFPGDRCSREVREEILDSVNAAYEESQRASGRKQQQLGNGSRHKLGGETGGAGGAGAGARDRAQSPSRRKSVFTEEDLFTWVEARLALDMIGRVCSMGIFVIVLLALYARISQL